MSLLSRWERQRGNHVQDQQFQGIVSGREEHVDHVQQVWLSFWKFFQFKKKNEIFYITKEDDVFV